MTSADITDKQYAGYVMRGSDLYWSVLGGIRGGGIHRWNGLEWVGGLGARGNYSLTYSVRLKNESPGRQAAEMTAKIKAGELPKSMIICPCLYDFDIIGLFGRCGDFDIESDTGMVKELGPAPAFPQPLPDMALCRVEDLERLKLAGCVLSAAFEYDFFSFGQYADIFNTPGAVFYLAEQAGMPVGACMALHGDGFMEIAWVGTLKASRGKGIAGLLLQTAENDSVKNHISVSVMSAFPCAAGAYLRAGYRKCCDVVKITLKG